MARQYDVRRSNESPQKDADNWILQRTAVRELPAKPLTPQTETAASHCSGMKLDLMQIPVSNHSAMPVQAKLEIRPAGDKYEQEADQVAKQVVQKLHGPQPRKLQQKNPEVEEELQRKPRLQLKGDRAGMTAAPELESSITRSLGSGQSLSDRIREPMEKGFGGVDFSGVKVHTDGTSDRLNQSMQAKAFTTGQDVFFRQGAYNPGSQRGQELIAHELTHVVQQNGGKVQRQIVQRAGDDEHKKKKNRLEPSKFRSQHTRDAIRDAAEAREQGIPVDELRTKKEELRTQEQEERLRRFRASLTGRHAEEFDQLREQLNAMGAGLEKGCDQMLQILEEENNLHQIVTQIATVPVETGDKSPEDIAGEQLGKHMKELNRNASFYREQEQRSNKKKGFQKIRESEKSKTKRKAETASNAQKAQEYEKQRQLIIDNKSRLANIIPLHNVRTNKDVGDIKPQTITKMTKYVDEQIETAGSEFDVSHLHELAGYLKQEAIVRNLFIEIVADGIQSFYRDRQKVQEAIETYQKQIEGLQPGRVESLLGKIGITDNAEREQLIDKGQQALENAINKLEKINSSIELIEAPRYKERIERRENMYQRGKFRRN